MWKKLIMLVLVIFFAATAYGIYVRANEKTYSIDLEEQLVIDGVAYVKLEDIYVPVRDNNDKCIGRVQNDFTDFVLPTRIYYAKEGEKDFLLCKNMYKEEVYRRRELELPEFKKQNVAHVILDSVHAEEEDKVIQDANTVDYLYNFVKETYNNPKGKELKEAKEDSFVEMYALQFKLNGMENALVEPSFVIECTDGDIRTYNKVPDRYNAEEKTYRTYVLEESVRNNLFKK